MDLLPEKKLFLAIILEIFLRNVTVLNCNANNEILNYCVQLSYITIMLLYHLAY